MEPDLITDRTAQQVAEVERGTLQRSDQGSTRTVGPGGNTFAGSIGSIIHCDCNYVPGMLRLGEMHDVAGLIAPRPFLAVAGRDDPIFPAAHTRAAFEQLADIYDAAGDRDRCELYIGSGGHRYYKERVWPFIAEAFAAVR